MWNENRVEPNNKTVKLMLFKSWQLWRCILWDLSFGNSSWASAAVCLSPAETISLLKSFKKTLGRSQLSCWMKTNCLKWQQVVVETDGGKEAVAEKRSRQPSLWEGWPGDQLGGRVPSLAYRAGWFFLTVPPNFQCQTEKWWAANQRFCSMKFSMYNWSS